MKSLSSNSLPVRVAIIGGGPAGLMAAEVLSGATPAVSVRLFDAMPSVGRKFLLAGKGGLNLTHSEGPAVFASRYGERSAEVAALLDGFGGAEVRDWAQGLGVETFVGSSGRVFPQNLKAAPLLRAWLHRLRQAGVQFSMRHRWLGWTESGDLKFAVPAGEESVQADFVILALGGGSWARLGSDGAWVPLLAQKDVLVAPLRPSNCGFDVSAGQPGTGTGTGWSEHFVERFAGAPFKSVAIEFTDSQGRYFRRKGEFVATHSGVEGSLIYAASALLRDEISRNGSATFLLDLLPDKTPAQVLAEVLHPRGSRSMSSHLKSRLHLEGIKAGVLRELLDKPAWADPSQLAQSIKALPVRLLRPRPLDEAISSAGGVRFEALGAGLQLSHSPVAGQSVFCAGEMLDWEAPTGGYLLTACLASGRRAGQAALQQIDLASTSLKSQGRTE